MQSSANETQVGGHHYKASIQHWDFAASRCMGYFEGQVTKYVTRWRKKNGLQDLRKAEHFLAKLRELAAAKAATPQQTFLMAEIPPLAVISVDDYVKSNELTADEALVVALVTEWEGHCELLESAHFTLQRMIAEAEGSEPGSGYVNQG